MIQEGLWKSIIVGWMRDMRAAPRVARIDAAHAVRCVIEPILDLDIDFEQGLTAKLKAVDEKIREARLTGKPVPQSLLDESAAITAKMNANPYHLFRMAVLYRDLWYRGHIDTGRKDPGGNPVMVMLPNGLTVEETEAILKDVHDTIANHASRGAIEEALRRHYQLISDTREDMIRHGYLITEEMANPLYFPHIVLEKWNGYISLDSAEPFWKYLERLSETGWAIESNYIAAMLKHLTEVYANNRRIELTERMRSQFDIRRRFRSPTSEAADGMGKHANANEWRQIIPDNYEIYLPDERLPLRPDTSIDRTALETSLGIKLEEGGDIAKAIEEAGVVIKASGLRYALAAKRPTPWVIPAEVANAIRQTVMDEAAKALRGPQNLGGRKPTFMDDVAQGLLMRQVLGRKRS